MATCGLLVRFEARHGREGEAEQFLRNALPLARQEPATLAWFAIRFGRYDYGIFDVFPDIAGRDAHLSGPIANALGERSEELFIAPPAIRKFDILAEKLGTGPIAKGLLLTFKAKSGHEQQVAQFLREAKEFVLQEPGTVEWFAIRLEGGEYGIFDVFPDNGARFSHLTGHVPRDLAKHALSLLGGMPDLHMLEIVAAKP